MSYHVAPRSVPTYVTLARRELRRLAARRRSKVYPVVWVFFNRHGGRPTGLRLGNRWLTTRRAVTLEAPAVLVYRGRGSAQPKFYARLERVVLRRYPGRLIIKRECFA